MRPLRRSRSRPVDVESDARGRGRWPSADPVDLQGGSPGGDGSGARSVEAPPGRAREGRPADDDFSPEELFPPDDPFPFPEGVDDGVPASGSATAAEPARASAVSPGAPLPGQRMRVRLRVGIGAAAALVGAALVITILVTAFQAAQGGTTTASSGAGSTSAEHRAPGSSGRGARASEDDDAAAGASAGSPGEGAGADPGAVGSEAAGAGDADADDPPGTGSTTPIYVHVVGAVVSPGLFPLAPGSRVVDAVAAAHGFADGADPSGVNLARVLTDGEQLVVPRQGETAAPAAPGATGASAAGASPSTPVDLNTATAEQLETLPRVGPSLAARIIAWRSAHGRFTRVADLGRVPGIGDRTLASLTPLVRV